MVLCRLREGILDVIYPPVCPMCGRVLRQHYHPEYEIGADISLNGYNAPICASCYKQLPRTEEAENRGNLTEDKFIRERRFVRGAAFLFFEKEHPSQQLIHAIKFGNRPDLAFYLGMLIAEEYAHTGFFDDIDLMIPVPLHKNRLRERGYNQSEYIAKGIQSMLGLPIDELNHIERVRDTHQQALTSGKDREENVRGAFRVNHPEELYRKHILLIDDVVTTGATLSAMMEALIPARGAKYSVLTLGVAV